MAELNACTIVAKNYLPHARVLARSFRAHHPGGRFFVLLVDRVDGRFDPAAEPFELVEVGDLGNIPELDGFLFKYTILEASTAVKPYLLEHLLVEHRLERLVYLDPDILVTRRLEPVERLLEQSAIVLTPHLTGPIEDRAKPDELTVLRSGAYNLGFIALADRPPVRDLLRWWQQRVFDRCVVRVEEGLFVDQKWVDLVPGMFPSVAILRHPGCNVAYWNLHCRRVELGPEPTVNGEPLHFFHFSGLEVDDLEIVSRHQNRFRLKDLGEVRQLFTRYRELLLEQGYRQASSWPYTFGSFDDGTAIPDVARAFYRSLGAERSRFGSPFATGEGSFLAWMTAPVEGHGPGRLSRLLYHLHQTSPGLRLNFPDPCGRSHAGLLKWFDTYGRVDFKLPDAFLGGPQGGGPGAAPGVARSTRRQLRTLVEWRPLWRAKERVKSAFGEERWMAVKRRLFPSWVAARDSRVVAAPAPEPDLSRVGLNITGYVTTESGIGQGLRGLIRAVEHAGIPHVLADVGYGVRSRREDGSFTAFTDEPEYGINIFGVNADQVEAVGEHVGWGRFHGRYNVGCWSWELESFPGRFRSAFAHFDEIWTPSRFCVEALSAVSPVPVRRMPHLVEMEPEPIADRKAFGLPDDRFLFLFTFDFLSFAERKNPLGLVRAFKQAFGAGEPVLLVLKCANSERDPQALEALQREIAGAPVELVDRYLSRADVDRLMASCDAYVSLHRSEGFGLTMAEAMALGKPVIATGYSGNTDFMDLNNSLLVRFRMVRLEEDVGPYERGNLWAEPDLEHAAELMRLLVARPDLCRSLGERAKADVRDRLGRDAVAELVRQRLREILRRHPGGPALTHPAHML